MPEKRIVVN